MKPGPGLIDSILRNQVSPVSPPRFLIERDPWYRTFLGSCSAFYPPRTETLPGSAVVPGQFWNDVFVKSTLPWRRFVESVIFHGAAIVLLANLSQLELQRPHLTHPAPSQSSEVIRYDASEYLTPLDTGSLPASARRGDPVYAPQPIISVPAESDNSQQTVVTPPVLKLNGDLALPNIVSWQHSVPRIAAPIVPSRTSDLRLPVSPTVPIAPPPAVSRSTVNPAPFLSAAAVAPAPDVSGGSSRNLAMPQPAIVGPPPGIEIAALRKVSDINIGPAQVVAPAPELPVSERHTLPSPPRSGPSDPITEVVPPPPNLPQTGGTHSDDRLIALSVHPSPPSVAVTVPTGNRRGSFAASPEGRPTAAGTVGQLPTSPANQGTAGFSSSKQMNGVPRGLLVGSGHEPSSKSSIVGNSSGSDPAPDPPLEARAASPRAIALTLSPEQENESERQVFGVRKSYSMTLNVPNLNSAGGSLIMHFSELNEGPTQGDLFAPVVTRAVVPGYPLELMRENVQGIVELAAVINNDGSVSEIRALNDADDRLQAYAREALLRWQFLPALRNGKPVPLQAVVRIPFKPRATRGF
jgi:TonB family protein